MSKKTTLTSNDITDVQIIAKLNDGSHIIAVSSEKQLIWHIVASCKFAKLKDELFEQCPLSELVATED